MKHHVVVCVIKQQTAWNEWHSGTIYDSFLVFPCRSWGAWHGVWSLGHYVLSKCGNGRLSMVSSGLAFSFHHRPSGTLSVVYSELALSCNMGGTLGYGPVYRASNTKVVFPAEDELLTVQYSLIHGKECISSPPDKKNFG